MERERLTRLLEDPARITRQDLPDLVAMAERYPWFSAAQLLRAAGERLGGDVLSDETLRVAGAHLPSRTVLFDLTNGSAPKAQAPMRVVRTEAVPATEAAPIEEKVNAVTERPPATAVAPAPEPMPPQEPPVAPLPVQPAPVGADTVDELDLQILENAASGAYDITFLEQVPAPAQELPPPTASIPSSPSTLPEPPPIDAGRNARLRFTQWLEASGRPAPTPPTQATDLRPDRAQEQLDTNTLIDRFIRHETPEPRKTAFFTPQQAGKRSLDDSAGMVTETLARIYARQGNTAKAIEAYRRLALKYPEKSAYFAALSKALEEQQNP